MKTLTIGLGVKSNVVQTSMLNYAILRTAGVTLTEFMKAADGIGALTTFNGKLRKPGNVLEFQCTVFDDINQDGVKEQIIQLVLLQLAVAEISLGEFEYAIRQNAK